MAKKDVVVVKELTIFEKLNSIESQRSLSDVVSKFLGYHVYMNIKTELNRHEKQIVDVTSHPLGVRHMGVARFLFKSFVLGSFGSIWIDDDPEKKDADRHNPRFDLHASYEHPAGGSNGHALYVGEDRIMLEFDPKTLAWFVSVSR